MSIPIAYASTSVERIIVLISRIVARLFVSFPSEITTIAFFRWRPVCASGTADATASYSDVAPRGRIRASPVAIRSRSVVQVFDELGLIVEAIQEHFVVSIEQLEEEAIERLPRRHPFLALHAAARVDDEPEADRHALAVEVRDLLFLAVLEETEVFLAQARRRTGRWRR